MERVERQEREGQIPAWDEVASTAAVIPPDEAPEPGSVSSSQQWPYVGATEIRLENGMTVGLDFGKIPGWPDDPCVSHYNILINYL